MCLKFQLICKQTDPRRRSRNSPPRAARPAAVRATRPATMTTTTTTVAATVARASRASPAWTLTSRYVFPPSLGSCWFVFVQNTHHFYYCYNYSARSRPWAARRRVVRLSRAAKRPRRRAARGGLLLRREQEGRGGKKEFEEISGKESDGCVCVSECTCSVRLTRIVTEVFPPNGFCWVMRVLL